MDWNPAQLDFDQPFQEAIAYWKSKGIVLSPEGWRDVWEAAHAGAFTVARVAEIELLADIKAELERAMETGETLREFKRNLREAIENSGWTGGTPSRLENIFRTNLAAAYNVGRWKQIEEVADRRPWLQYLGISDSRTRPRHRAMFGLVYRHDDPIWNQWYPPNGFRCRCYVRTLSDSEVARRGLSPALGRPENDDGTPMIPDAGWRYHPGKAGLDSWKPDLSKYPPEIAALIQQRLPGM